MHLKPFYFITSGFIMFYCYINDPLFAQDKSKYDVYNSTREKVGAQLTSTGTEQNPPRIVNAATIAPDVLCIEVDACHILPSFQIPYQEDSADILTVIHSSSLGEENAIRVVRNGFPLGMIVGPGRKTLTIFERIAGLHLNTVVADNPANYTIISAGDNNYIHKLLPSAVWRKSKPTNYPEENRHYGEYYTAKHFIYLKLPYPLKSGVTYLISLPELEINCSAFYYVNDPSFVRSEAVHASQVGFRADDPEKYAFLSSWMGNGGAYNYPENLEFSIIDEKTNEKLYSGKAVMQWRKDDPEGIGSKVNHTQADVIRLDFSNFNTPGKYRVCVEGVGCSYPFYIDSANTWLKAFKVSMKGHFNQRSGIPLLPPYTDFVRPRSFSPKDGVKVYQSTCSLLNSGNGLNALGTDKDNFGNLVAGRTDELVPEAWGGTMDAGDWDRRIKHLNSPRLYLELMELYPDYFKDICLNIPESENDLPDLVDEALYGLDIYRRMQLPDGGIRGGVESSEHPAEGSASWQEVLSVYAYAPDHWSSYIYAGVAARAAHVLKLLGKQEKAVIWEESAIKAIKWAETEYDKWIKSPDYIKVSSNAKTQVAIERNLAAIEVYKLTKEKRWHELYLATQKFETIRTDAIFIYARLDKSMVTLKAQKIAVDSLIRKADRLVEISGKSAYGITTSIPGRALGGWESTYSIPASPTLVRAHFLTGNDKYLKTLLRSTLFSAGANPMNLVLTTGLGENCVQHPLHEDSRHTGQPAPIGLTVCGPGEIPVFAKPGSDMGERLNKECTPSGYEWPSAESYFDVYGWDLENEYVVDRNIGPSAYIWGYLAARK
jgi:endoglucanase